MRRGSGRPAGLGRGGGAWAAGAREAARPPSRGTLRKGLAAKDPWRVAGRPLRASSARKVPPPKPFWSETSLACALQPTLGTSHRHRGPLKGVFRPHPSAGGGRGHLPGASSPSRARRCAAKRRKGPCRAPWGQGHPAGAALKNRGACQRGRSSGASRQMAPRKGDAPKNQGALARGRAGERPRLVGPTTGPRRAALPCGPAARPVASGRVAGRVPDPPPTPRRPPRPPRGASR